ncbi:MAG: 30S ribosome-binding factor RbfA [Acidobacteria bacterium]|nr:30S ribosome-binding factor RbfA [Acidobacteriota bacterium]MCW5966894.1 30S ribosome-binding factor RbfA [Blastocatellales bacterium]
MSYRAQRLAHELREKLSLLIARELRDPRVGFATLTGLDLSPDRRYARVYVSVFGDPAEQRRSLDALNEASGFLRRLLGASVRLRYTPELNFVFDASVEQGARMERILDELKLDELKQETPDESAQTTPDGADESSEPRSDAH